LPKDTISELADLSLHYPFYAEVKQGSCEYQLLKSFGPTRPGNRTLVYQLRGGRSRPRAGEKMVSCLLFKRT